VAAIAGSLQVLRLHKHHGQLVPATGWQPEQTLDMEIWGVVTTLIRKV
jgi:DNA polymerase V